ANPPGLLSSHQFPLTVRATSSTLLLSISCIFAAYSESLAVLETRPSFLSSSPILYTRSVSANRSGCDSMKSANASQTLSSLESVRLISCDCTPPDIASRPSTPTLTHPTPQP